MVGEFTCGSLEGVVAIHVQGGSWLGQEVVEGYRSGMYIVHAS